MAENKNNNTPSPAEEEKKSKGMTGCLIILLILLLTPLLVVGGLYFLNKDFKMNVNGLMSNVPGPVGSYFSDFPTRAEELEQIKIISRYMIDLPEERAVDKLMVLNSEDSDAYNEVIKDMLRLNPNRTRSILDAIRDATVSKDALQNTVSQIEVEKQEALKATAAYIAGLPLDAAIAEVEDMIEESLEGHSDAAAMFEHMDHEQAMRILYQMDVADRNRVFSSMSDENKEAIQQAYSDLTRRNSDLEQIAGVYQSENPLNLIDSIGESSNYTLDELAVIYKNLGPRKAGEVLAKSLDENFVFDLVSKIKANEIMENGEDTLTPDILKSLKVFREFDDNVKELVNVYSRMANTDILPIIESMMINAAPSAIYELDNGDLIRISDEDFVLQLLKSFTEKKRSELLSLMDRTLSTELTRKLALPNQ